MNKKESTQTTTFTRNLIIKHVGPLAVTVHFDFRLRIEFRWNAILGDDVRARWTRHTIRCIGWVRAVASRDDHFVCPGFSPYSAGIVYLPLVMAAPVLEPVDENSMIPSSSGSPFKVTEPLISTLPSVPPQPTKDLARTREKRMHRIAACTNSRR